MRGRVIAAGLRSAVACLDCMDLGLVQVPGPADRSEPRRCDAPGCTAGQHQADPLMGLRTSDRTREGALAARERFASLLGKSRLARVGVELRIGDRVRYSSVIGQPPGPEVYVVREVGTLGEEAVAWLDGKAGAVSIDALELYR